MKDTGHIEGDADRDFDEESRILSMAAILGIECTFHVWKTPVFVTESGYMSFYLTDCEPAFRQEIMANQYDQLSFYRAAEELLMRKAIYDSKS